MIFFLLAAAIGVQNSIITQVGDKTISVVDVQKKLDVAFYQNYPQYEKVPEARIQFYNAGFEHTMRDMVDHELILADAADKQVKVSDGEIREVMDEKFGPNVVETLEKIGLTYDEAWNMTRDEMIVQRMSWWFIHARAQAAVTPGAIRKAYKAYLEKNPPYADWKYQVITFKSADAAEEAYRMLLKTGEMKDLPAGKEFCNKTHELSEAHKTALEFLEPGEYSAPIPSKGTYRIFYLVEKTDHPAPSFEAMTPRLKVELTQVATVKESQEYVSKLRKKYGYEAENALPKDLHPFFLR